LQESLGDDIYADNTEGDLILSGLLIENPRASQSVYAESLNLTLARVTMRDVGSKPEKTITRGAGL
jgi:hypothetical protein